VQAWTSLLESTDAALASDGGQCAIVLATVIGTRIVGASIGDCGAWLVDDRTADLTAKQFRKPLLGSGASKAVPFEAELNDGATLLLAFRRAPQARFARSDLIAGARAGTRSAAARLSELPRLRSGDLLDDVAVVLCRASTR